MAAFTLDDVIRILSSSLFSSLPCLTYLVAIRFLAGSTSHPLITAAYVWTGIVSFFGISNHIDRIHANQLPWFSARQRIDWSKQIVLITGGGSGIGALLAKTVAASGARVAVLTKTKPENEEPKGAIVTYICDISSFAQVQEVAKKVQEEVMRLMFLDEVRCQSSDKIGDPTILVNNAGVVKGKLLLDLTEEDITDTFAANTLGQFWVLKGFLPAMLRAGKGHIVSISSILGIIGTAQMTDYCASKAALVNLHQCLRSELDARYKTPLIRTTLVLPALIKTHLFADARFPTSRLFNFLAPAMLPQTVVASIIAALEDDQSRVIRLPWYSNLARIMGDGVGIMPTWLRASLQWFTDADHVMREFGPHPDAAERLAMERSQIASTKEE